MGDSNHTHDGKPDELIGRRALNALRGIQLQTNYCWLAIQEERFIEGHESAKELVALVDDLLGTMEVLFLAAMHEPTNS